MNDTTREQAILTRIDEKGPLVIYVFLALVVGGSAVMVVYDTMKGVIR